MTARLARDRRSCSMGAAGSVSVERLVSEGAKRPRAAAKTWPVRIGAPGAGIAPVERNFSYPIERVRAWLRAEAGAGRLLPWIPVAFGCGIALYFAADREPVAWIAGITAASLSLAAFACRRNRAFVPVVLIAALACGFAAAALKAARVAHGVLARPVYTANIAGFVETHEERERTDRFVLRVVTMDSPRGTPALQRVRLSVKKGTGPAVGSFVTLKARLLPPLQPLRPGAYDFARDLYFQGTGASGFAMGAISVGAPPPNAEAGWTLRYAAAMQGLRDAIDARIRAVLNGDHRAIATALLTGRRDAISTPVNDAMFISGLGHVLSISGYHMAVVAGLVFFAIRALLALSPAFTAACPIKKWAAAAALAAAAFYLLLSGAEVATQRSFVMTAVVLIAVMVDRRAITFRTLAIAALAVLILTPEALVHPSFQMSFAATLGLVALVQFGMPKLFASPDHSASARAALWGGRELIMLTLASLIAGLATTPYAAFHFHRIAPYGVIANLAAMPVVSAIVMPAGIFGLIAMPFGLDRIFWRLMEFGIGWMIAVAQWVAALPGSVGPVPAFAIRPLLIASCGIIVLGLLRTPLRLGGIALIAAGALWAAATPRPDILVAADTHAVGVRGKDGRLRVMRTARDAFLVREWLTADGDTRTSDASVEAGVSCDEEGCVAPLADGTLVALAKKREALADDCREAAIVVTAFAAPADCAARVIAAEELRGSGAVVLYRRGDAWRVEATRRNGAQRPWSPSAPDFTEPANTSAPRAVRPPRDATPAERDLQADE